MTTQTLTYGKVTWTDIGKATENDIRLLRANHPDFHPLDLEDLLSRIERPKLDEYDNYLFVVMQFPVWDPKSRVSRATEVDIFIGEGFLVTVHDGALKPLANLFLQCQEDETLRHRYMGKGSSRLFYAVIDSLVDYILPILYKVDANIRAIEEDLFTEDLQKVIENITFVRRDIIALRRIIRPQIGIVANLEKVDRTFIHEELDVYFGDILDHIQKASDLLSDHAEVIEVLAESADTLASHRINEVMRILTVISVIMLPLTLISGIYGMNVALPIQNSPYAFTLIIAGMFVLILAMLVFFRRKKWL
ncbi:MAG: magnesium transporter CorA family protein [Anaerolineae bacterium]|nr:magnesium transporter CorA family protein [Anaerolineae bacterium]